MGLSGLNYKEQLWTDIVYMGQERRGVCCQVLLIGGSLVCAALFKKEGLCVKVMKQYLKEKQWLKHVNYMSVWAICCRG